MLALAPAGFLLVLRVAARRPRRRDLRAGGVGRGRRRRRRGGRAGLSMVVEKRRDGALSPRAANGRGAKATALAQDSAATTKEKHFGIAACQSVLRPQHASKLAFRGAVGFALLSLDSVSLLLLQRDGGLRRARRRRDLRAGTRGARSARASTRVTRTRATAAPRARRCRSSSGAARLKTAACPDIPRPGPPRSSTFPRPFPSMTSPTSRVASLGSSIWQTDSVCAPGCPHAAAA